MPVADFTADARLLWRLLRGQPKGGSHAERLQAFYAPQAERYDAFRARLLHGREELIEKLAITPGERIVELGCGTGSSLERLGGRVSELTSLHLVDLCPALLDQARQRAAGQTNVRVIEADATRWQPEVPVDVVFLSYALTMIPDWAAAIANAHAMLRPGGRIGIVDFHLPTDGNRVGMRFWRSWFGHDGVHLSAKHLPTLRQRFTECQCNERRAAVPYLPGLRAPYYIFVGERTD